MFLKYNSVVRFIKVGKFSIPAGIWHEALNRGVAVYLKTQVEKFLCLLSEQVATIPSKRGSSVEALLSLPHQ